MKKILNTLKLSLLLFRQEKKKIVFYNIIFFIMVFLTVVCSTLSLELDNALANSEANSASNTKELTIKGQDLELPNALMDYASSLGEHTIVKKTIYTLDNYNIKFDFYRQNEETGELEQKSSTSNYFYYFQMIDPNYDTYEMYSDTSQGMQPFTKDMDLAMIDRLNHMEPGKYTILFDYQNKSYSLDVDVIACNPYDDVCVSPNLAKRLQEIIPEIQQGETKYKFSYRSIQVALKLYHYCLDLNPLLSSYISFNGIGIEEYMNSMKQVGTVLYVITLIAFITIIVSFINMILILFLDKQKYIGLLRAQGITNIRLGVILIAPLLFTFLITSVIAIICSITLTNPILATLGDIFIKQFIKNVSLCTHNELNILLPLLGYILIAVPIIIFIIFITKKDTISLLKGK